jgi:hypothetical protein
LQFRIEDRTRASRQVQRPSSRSGILQRAEKSAKLVTRERANTGVLHFLSKMATGATHEQPTRDILRTSFIGVGRGEGPAFEIEPTGVGSFAGSVRGTKNEVMRKTRFPKKPLANFDFRRRCGATVVDFRRRNNAYGTSMALCRGDSIGLFLAIDYKSTAE